MFIRKIAIVAALCALSVVALASSASATTVKTAGGYTLVSGDAVMGTLKSGTTAVLTSSSGNISCTASTFDLKVGANGGATVSGTLPAPSGLLFNGTCTDTVSGATFSSCNLGDPYTVTITATGSPVTGGTVGVGGLRVKCNYTDDVFHQAGWCSFTAQAGAQGTFLNSTNTLTFSNVQVASPGWPCPSSGAFSAAYTPVQYIPAGGGTPQPSSNNIVIA